jgi:hypothetical protein
MLNTNEVQDDALIIGSIQRYIHDNISIQHLYSPVIFKDFLVTDGCKRKYDHQHDRIKYILDNINDKETILDLGCNTGFMINELIRFKDIKATGVDNIGCLIKLCELIHSYQDSKSTFILNDMNDFIIACQRNGKTFDNVIIASVFEFEEIISMVDALLSITKKRLFLEPTNHKLYSIEELNKYYIDSFKKIYRIKILGHTDYQNRVMLMVDKNA